MKTFKAIIATILALAALQGCDSNSSSSGKVDLSSAKLGYSGGFVDLNGDGLEDLVVGAPDASASPVKGAVLAYYNSPEGFSPARTWLLEGEKAGDSFGFSFAKVGDVDGDGYEDFAVGAVHAAGETPLSGAVYVYRGGQDGPFLIQRLQGNLSLDKFGFKIAGDDLNNDGYSDVVVSAVYETADAYQSGTVSIFFGGATIGATPDIVIRGDSTNGGNGFGIATGDINGDNIADLFVGSGHSVHIYYGSTDLIGRLALSQEADVHISGQTEGGGGHSGHGFGDSLAYMGDVNNDGFGDLAVGNWRRSLPDSPDYKGSIYIFKGGNELPHEFYENNLEYQLVKITGAADTDLFGTAIAVTTDINNGGLPDLLVSAPWTTGGKSGDSKVSGKIYLFHTEELLQTPPALYDATMAARTFTENTASGEFGIALAADGNGLFFAGAPFVNQNEGSAFLFNARTGDTVHLTND